jgi:hypothetical protein
MFHLPIESPNYRKSEHHCEARVGHCLRQILAAFAEVYMASKGEPRSPPSTEKVLAKLVGDVSTPKA